MSTFTKPPRPLDEAERLEVLKSYRLMDTEPERAYDDIVQVASRLCGVPIALVTLLDEDRQWFKAKVGLDADQTTRDEAFCSYTIMDDSVMVVTDARQDPRFRDNPLVTGSPDIRFYAGAPLITPEGHSLGSLCVIDTEPREITPEQEESLAGLARLVVDQIQQRKAAAELAEALERVKTLGRLIPICSYCRQVRDDNDYWQSLESYLKSQVDVDVTHGICPNCVEEHFPSEAGE